jgi:hypothetical protein
MAVTLSLTRLVDSVNMVFVTYTTYQLGVTNFGDYQPISLLPWYGSKTAVVYI